MLEEFISGAASPCLAKANAARRTEARGFSSACRPPDEQCGVRCDPAEDVLLAYIRPFSLRFLIESIGNVLR